MTTLLREIPRGAKMSGLVLTWSCEGLKLRHHQVARFLEEHGLDQTAVHERSFRNAFIRACRQMEDVRRMIRRLGEDEETITFQMTDEAVKEVTDDAERAELGSDEKLIYDVTAVLVADKETGRVRSVNKEMAARAEELLNGVGRVYDGTDLTKIIKRLFERREKEQRTLEGGLHKLPGSGAGYFILGPHVEFALQVERCVRAMGGSIAALPTLSGTDYGDRSLGEVLTASAEADLKALEKEIDRFTEDTSERAMESKAEQIQLIELRIEAKASLMTDTAQATMDQAKRIRAKLSAKSAPVASLSAP